MPQSLFSSATNFTLQLKINFQVNAEFCQKVPAFLGYGTSPLLIISQLKINYSLYFSTQTKYKIIVRGKSTTVQHN